MKGHPWCIPTSKLPILLGLDYIWLNIPYLLKDITQDTMLYLLSLGLRDGTEIKVLPSM